MDTLVCGDVRRWVQQEVVAKNPIAPDPAVCDHIASCDLCQGALALLALEALDLPELPKDIDCEQCAEQLAAFIDLEAEEGSSAAIHAYPHVWWHLWTCALCGETYGMARSLLAAEQLERIEIRPLPTIELHPVVVQQPILKLPHAVVYAALAPSTSGRGVYRGSASSRNVLVDTETPNGQLTLSARSQTAEHWQLDVLVQPRPPGMLVLSLGTARYRVAFNQQGEASIRDVPAALLTAPEGPDLELTIEPA